MRKQLEQGQRPCCHWLCVAAVRDSCKQCSPAAGFGERDGSCRICQPVNVQLLCASCAYTGWMCCCQHSGRMVSCSVLLQTNSLGFGVTGHLQHHS